MANITQGITPAAISPLIFRVREFTDKLKQKKIDLLGIKILV